MTASGTAQPQTPQGFPVEISRKAAKANEDPILFSDQILIDQLSWLKAFDIPEIQHPVLDFLGDAQSDKEKCHQVYNDPNLVIQFQKLGIISQFEPPSIYRNAFINFARLNVVLFSQNPWWRSRVGWLDWTSTCYANPDSYFVLKWENLYDPRNWYRVGEVRRPEHGGPVPEGAEPSTHL